jgi:hypothetical protein
VLDAHERALVARRHQRAEEGRLERGIGLRIPVRVLVPDDGAEVLLVPDLPVGRVRSEEREIDSGVPCVLEVVSDALRPVLAVAGDGDRLAADE